MYLAMYVVSISNSTAERSQDLKITSSDLDASAVSYVQAPTSNNKFCPESRQKKTKKNMQAPAEKIDKSNLEHDINASGNPKSQLCNLTHVGSREPMFLQFFCWLENWKSPAREASDNRTDTWITGILIES